MTQINTERAVSPLYRQHGRPTVWGLTASDLHKAFWHARGVQCIRRGERQMLQRAAELFLLLEPGQLVLFNLAELATRLIWRKALVTRLRVVDQEEETYSERIVVDQRGLVERIERWYGPRARGSFRVVLTVSRRIARIWMAASTSRRGWESVRRSVSWSRIDHSRCRGTCFAEGNVDQENALLSRLVASWPNPGQSIDGIVQVGEGIWTMTGETISEDAALLEPAWLGCGRPSGSGAYLIGPVWTPDQMPVEGKDVRKAAVRDIEDIELAEAAKESRTARKRDSTYAVAKRAFDILLSLIVLLFALPLFAIVALCILLDDGRPVFYGHPRQTRGGRSFRCWKFRTMCRDADTMTQELAERNICDGPQVYIHRDPRLTRLGRVMRRFQLDEYPQFWNVLLGQMSIVGPRPSPEQENQYCPAWRDQRLSVRPGITGLWQLQRTRAPGEDFQEWIKYDIEYVRRASFWFDLSICLRTVWMLLRGTRA